LEDERAAVEAAVSGARQRALSIAAEVEQLRGMLAERLPLLNAAATQHAAVRSQLRGSGSTIAGSGGARGGSSGLMALPPTLLAHVMSFLRLRDYTQCLRVNKQFYFAFSHPVVATTHLAHTLDALADRRDAAAGAQQKARVLLELPAVVHARATLDLREVRRRVGWKPKQPPTAQQVDAVSEALLEAAAEHTKEQMRVGQSSREDLHQQWEGAQTVMRFLEEQERQLAAALSAGTAARIAAEDEMDCVSRAKEELAAQLSEAEASVAAQRAALEREVRELRESERRARAEVEHLQDTRGLSGFSWSEGLVGTPGSAPASAPGSVSTNPFSPSYGSPVPGAGTSPGDAGTLKQEKKILIRAVKQLRAELGAMKTQNDDLAERLAKAGVEVPPREDFAIQTPK
jgi:hypothetical protein